MDNLIKKLSGFKGIGFIVLALVAGVLLLIWPDNSTKQIATATPSSSEAYAADAEKQARALINQIGGVKSSQIMITLSDGYSYLYASNQKLKNDGDARDVEKEVVIITTDGKQSPIIICEYTPKISGVAVVYEGDASAAGRIKTLLSVLFGISEEYIYITS